MNICLYLHQQVPGTAVKMENKENKVYFMVALYSGG